jgi:butyryl-CoA dehydrogenase
MATLPYLNEDHLELQARVRDFAKQAIEPVARGMDERSEFPWENVKAMGGLGLLGVPIPESLGGMGRDYRSYILVVNELAKFDASHAITVSAHTTLGSGPILSFGTEAQKERFVPLLASGKVLGGFGLTEPGAGSDAGGTRTRAVREGDGYVLNGSKIFITHAGVGEVFTVTAVTDPEQGTRGISSFIVTKPTSEPERAASVGVGHEPELGYTDGVSAGAKEDKMGWRASDTRELHLQDAWVPEDHRLGDEGEGFVNFMKTLDAGRIGIAGLSLGLAEGALDYTIEYARQRSTFGKPLIEHQAIQFMLAEASTLIEASRGLMEKAALTYDSGNSNTKLASMAKYFCSDAAMKITTDMVQVLGGYGYIKDFPIERMFRDAKLTQIFEGANQIQKMIIGRELSKQ